MYNLSHIQPKIRSEQTEVICSFLVSKSIKYTETSFLNCQKVTVEVVFYIQVFTR